jgi:hypothetical protein
MFYRILHMKFFIFWCLPESSRSCALGNNFLQLRRTQVECRAGIQPGLAVHPVGPPAIEPRRTLIAKSHPKSQVFIVVIVKTFRF